MLKPEFLRSIGTIAWILLGCVIGMVFCTAQPDKLRSLWVEIYFRQFVESRTDTAIYRAASLASAHDGLLFRQKVKANIEELDAAHIRGAVTGLCSEWYSPYVWFEIAAKAVKSSSPNDARAFIRSLSLEARLLIFTEMTKQLPPEKETVKQLLLDTENDLMNARDILAQGQTGG
jgi:hypothetical protein